jgi:hypothetical protein
MDGVPTQTEGVSEILASDWNTFVRDNFDAIKFGHVTVADDSAKSSLSVAEGTMVYQLDNQKVFVYSGSVWVEVADIDRAGGLPETSPGHLIVADNTAKSALSATEGMMVYQSDNNKVFVYNGSSWVETNDLDNIGAISDSDWLTFVPTLSNGWALGNSTYDGFYMRVGDTVHFQAKITLGSTSTKSNNLIRVALPVAADDANVNTFIRCKFVDVGTAAWWGIGDFHSATEINLALYKVNNANGYASSQGYSLLTGVPFTVANNDEIFYWGTYRAG